MISNISRAFKTKALMATKSLAARSNQLAVHSDNPAPPMSLTPIAGLADGGMVPALLQPQGLETATKPNEPAVTALAEGGFVPPSLGGFVKDSISRIKAAVLPSNNTLKMAVASTAAKAPTAQSRADAIERQTSGQSDTPTPTPAPAPDPAATPAEPFKFADGGFMDAAKATIRNPLPPPTTARPIKTIGVRGEAEDGVQAADGPAYFADGGMLSAMLQARDGQTLPQVPVQAANPTHFTLGGAVKGPGTGTSDSVPAMLSHGEYVLPADTVRTVGIKALDGLKAATHTPVKHMADGGLANAAGNLWDWTKNAAGNAANAVKSAGTAPAAATAAAPPTAPPTASGAALQPGDWRSPIDTASAAAADGSPGTGATLLNGARSVVNNPMVRKYIAPLVVAKSIGDSAADDSTARYAQRFGVTPPTGDQSFGDMAKFAALRAGGFASDLGNNLSGGLAKNLYADSPTGTPAAAPAMAAAPATATQPAAAQPAVAQAAPTQNAGTDPDTVTMTPKGLSGARSDLFTNARTPTAADSYIPPSSAAALQEAYAPIDHGLPPSLQSHAGDTASGAPQDDSFLGQVQRNGQMRQQMKQQALALQQQEAQMRYGSDMYGHNVSAANSANEVAAQRENAAETHALTGAQQQMTGAMNANVMRQQAVTNAREQNEQDFNHEKEADNQLTKDLQTRNPGSKEGTFDDAAVATQKAGIQRSIARISQIHPEIKGIKDLKPNMREQLISASGLLSRIQGDASHINPFAPDYLKTIDPIDLTGLKKATDGSGDAIMRNGQNIPARYLRNKEGVRTILGFQRGTPTNEYDKLFTQ